MRKQSDEISEAAIRPGELTIAGYQLLRLHPGHWRPLIQQLVGPAIRLHDLKSARTRMWRDALCELECGNRIAKEGGCHE